MEKLIANALKQGSFKGHDFDFNLICLLVFSMSCSGGCHIMMITGNWHSSFEPNIKLIFELVSATVILQDHTANA